MRALLLSLLQRIALAIGLSVAVGSACAFFLWSLDVVTEIRFAHPWLVFLLPVGGFLAGLVYHWFGKSAEGGNNLLIDHIHEPGAGVPRRIAPLVLFGTLVTHLFGGSAGREGTAVQMGGGIASAFCRALRLQPSQVRIVLMMGVAAGFSAVFGTPLAGAVFALEVLAIGRMEYEALLPCFTVAILADWVCSAWGIHHTLYVIQSLAGVTAGKAPAWSDVLLLGQVILAAIIFGRASWAFAEASHRASAAFKRFIPFAPLRPAIGGLIVLGLLAIAQTPDYLGLGVWSVHPGAITIPSFFETAEVHPWSWLWKSLFTIATLSSGFKGGEVTPLFFIGAALGNVIAGVLGAPLDLFAGLGFVAVFAGATNTPLACTLMGIELFGSAHAVHLACACFVAYLASGHSGIYLSQRIGVAKRHNLRASIGHALRNLRER